MNFIFFKEKQKILPYIFGGILFLLNQYLRHLALIGKIKYFPNRFFVFGLPSSPIVIVSASIIILGLVIFLWRRTRHPALILIIIGGASNVFDRLVYGGVIDYIFIIPFAPFNLADGLIVIGIVWYALANSFRWRKPD